MALYTLSDRAVKSLGKMSQKDGEGILAKFEALPLPGSGPQTGSKKQRGQPKGDPVFFVRYGNYRGFYFWENDVARVLDVNNRQGSHGKKSRRSRRRQRRS